MKEKKYSPIQIKTKQLLAWILSVQIAGVTYVIPAMTFLSSFTITNLSYAGTDVIPGTPKTDKDKKAPLPPIIDGGHTSSETVETAPAKKKFCRDENGKWKEGCTVAAVLLGIGVIIALIAIARKNSKCTSCSNPPPPGRPDETPPPYPENPPGPPKVPCCNLPAPAPTGGGSTTTSVITSGSAPVPSVEPIQVND